MSNRKFLFPVEMGGDKDGDGVLELSETSLEDNRFHFFRSPAQQRAKEEHDTVQKRATLQQEGILVDRDKEGMYIQ